MTARLDLLPVTTESPGTRHAALFLHGIAAEDRAWLLDAIGAGGRATLEPLLVELDAIGVPASARLATDLLRQPVLVVDAPPATASMPAGAVAASPPRTVAPLARLPASTLLASLHGAPDMLVARALRQAGVRSRRALLRGLDAGRRQRVEMAVAELDASADAPRLDAALQQALLARVASTSDAGPVGLHRRAGAGVAKAWRRLAPRGRRHAEKA